MPLFGQEHFEAAQASEGLDCPAYEAAIADSVEVMRQAVGSHVPNPRSSCAHRCHQRAGLEDRRIRAGPHQQFVDCGGVRVSQHRGALGLGRGPAGRGLVHRTSAFGDRTSLAWRWRWRKLAARSLRLRSGKERRGDAIVRAGRAVKKRGRRLCHHTGDGKGRPHAGLTGTLKADIASGGDMRIIVNGQQAFGRAVLDALLERGEDVVGVFTAPDVEGGRPDPLKEGAVEHDIPLYQPKSFRREAVWEQIRELEPDLGVMAYVTLFVPEEALNIPDPWDDPVPPVAAAPAQGPEFHQLADHLRRDQDRAVDLLARQRARYRSRCCYRRRSDIGPGRYARQRLLRSSVP